MNHSHQHGHQLQLHHLSAIEPDRKMPLETRKNKLATIRSMVLVTDNICFSTYPNSLHGFNAVVVVVVVIVVVEVEVVDVVVVVIARSFR